MITGFALLAFLYFVWHCLTSEGVSYRLAKTGNQHGSVVVVIGWFIAASIATGLGAGVGLAISLIIGSF